MSTAAYIVDSRYVRQLLAGWGIAEASISIIPNAVDPAELDAPGDGARIRREMEIPSGAKLIGIIAHLFPEKGHESLLESFARASFPRGEIFLLIVGSGPLRDRLEHQAAALGIGSSVRFTGNRADLNDVLAAVDLCVLPSRWEGFGIVLAEALYKNVPVVATRGSGTEEIVEDGVTGALVDFGDVGALAAALQRGLFDSSWRKKTAPRERKGLARVDSGGSRVPLRRRLSNGESRRAAIMTPMQPEEVRRPAFVAGGEWNWFVSALRRYGPGALLFGVVAAAAATGVFLVSPRQFRSVALIEPPAVPYLDDKGQVQFKSLYRGLPSGNGRGGGIQRPHLDSNRPARAQDRRIDARVPRSTSLLSLSIVSSAPENDRRQLSALLEAIRSYLQPRVDLERSNLNNLLVAAQTEVEDHKSHIANFEQERLAIVKEQAVAGQQIQTARKKIEELEGRQIRATEKAGSEPALTALLYSNNLANLQQYVDSIQSRLTYDLKKREIEILNNLSTARRGLENAQSSIAVRETLIRSLRGFTVVQPSATLARPVGPPFLVLAGAAFLAAAAGYIAVRLALAALMSPGTVRP